MTKNHPVSFRLPTETRAALKKAAKNDQRSVSSLTTLILTEWLRQNGYLPASGS